MAETSSRTQEGPSMPLRHSRRSWLSGPASITRGFAHRVSRAILCALRAERPRERVIEQHFRQSVTNAAIERNDHTIATPVSYTHLRAHETPEHLVCRL